MKDQYFGDFNDYCKYALLRALVSGQDRRLFIHWMLTPPDGRSDGGKTSYLGKPERWRQIDPVLFDHLHSTTASSEKRSVKMIENSALLGKAAFSEGYIDRARDVRVAGMQRFLEAASPGDITFFDPDNGFEVPSMTSKSGPKYLLYDEARLAYQRGLSIAVFQHYSRVVRSQFHIGLVAACQERIGAEHILLWKTPNVVFALLSRQADCDLHANLRDFASLWPNGFEIEEYTRS